MELFNPVTKILKRKFYTNSFLVIAFVFFICAFFYRALNGYLSIKPHFDDFGTVIMTILRHDAIIVAAVLILYIFSSTTRGNFLKIPLRLLILGIFLLYCLDLAAFQIFSTRLSFNDLFHYISDINFIPGLFNISAFTGFILFIIFAECVFSTIVFIFHEGPQNKKALGGILLVAIVATGFYFSEKSNTYFIHNWVFKNFIENNLGRGLDTPYSKNFIDIVLKTGTDNKKGCEQTTKEIPPKNIIVLILESFSMYHSKFFSGINNFTPHLDAIAAEGRAFTNFISNGFTTEHGLIAIFTGKFPIPGIKESQYNFFSDSFKGYYNLENTLPQILGRNGYYSEFLTSGHLGFSNKGKWLENIGFDYIEGHEADCYKNSKRFHFEAAPDNALYERVFDRVRKHEPEIPFFLAIETVSTHLPFIDPVTEARSESLAMRFADNALGSFYNDLKRADFFDTGILIIVSDHRSMTMLTRKELEVFGPKAKALVPMVIVGSGFSGVEKQIFQQTDIFTSIENYISHNSCTSNFHGDFLNIPSKPPSYAVHIRGDDRSLIDIYKKESIATIRLEGDRTGVVAGNLENESYVVTKINYDRISKHLSFNPGLLEMLAK